MEKTFIKVRSIKDVLISSSMIIVGSILLALPTSASVNITGFFLIVAGLIFTLALKSDYKDVETGKKFCKKEHYFQQAMNPVISAAIASRPESVDLSEENKGSAVRLDIYFSKSCGKAYLQLFEYIPYRYEPCSGMYEYDVNRIQNLIG